MRFSDYVHQSQVAAQPIPCYLGLGGKVGVVFFLLRVSSCTVHCSTGVLSDKNGRRTPYSSTRTFVNTTVLQLNDYFTSGHQLTTRKSKSSIFFFCLRYFSLYISHALRKCVKGTNFLSAFCHALNQRITPEGARWPNGDAIQKGSASTFLFCARSSVFCVYLYLHTTLNTKVVPVNIYLENSVCSSSVLVPASA